MVMRLGMLAGEASGDNLGAGLMAALKTQLIDGSDTDQNIEFVGVGGPRMQAQGLRSLASMDELSVNGFRDPIVRPPSWIKLLRRLIREFEQGEIDAFVGIDFNVFNFLLEAALKRRGIPTAHYVSPSVYAWRAGRTKRVAKSADLLLCLYPFEPEFYADTPVRACYVGHPLADDIDLQAGDQAHRTQARMHLGLDPHATVLAILPGSRSSEVALMMDSFAQAAMAFARQHERVQIVIPCLRPALRERIEAVLQAYPDLSVCLYDGNARQGLVACDVALVKSGTSTLETMLLHRPMVVSYRLGWMTYQFARRVLRTPFVALPNILSQRELVPELLQDAATGPALAEALTGQLQAARQDANYFEPFVELHKRLRCGADQQSAAAVLGLLRA